MSLSNPDKIFFPKERITKQDILEYYLDVAHLILPLIKDRPITMHRYPSGITEKGFIQKNIPESVPKTLKTVQIKKKSSGEMTQLICQSKKALMYLVDIGCLTFHIPLSKTTHLNKPDRLIFDLDPSTKDFSKVKSAAFDLKEILEDELKLKTFVMTTGSKGLHIVIPIKPLLKFDEVRDFAKQVAQVLVSKNPKAYTIETRKAKRGRKVFIDYLRNGFAQTSVAPFSLRATDKASIAMPIDWKTLKKPFIKSDSFTLKQSKKYLQKNKNPWLNLSQSSQNLSKAKKLLDKLVKE